MYFEDDERKSTQNFEAVPKKRTKVVSEAKLRTLKREQGDNP